MSGGGKSARRNRTAPNFGFFGDNFPKMPKLIKYRLK